ncbi:histone H2A-like [Cetorhinus maximus]
MSDHGKTGGKGRAKAKTRSTRAGLQLPVGHIHRLLRNAKGVGAGAPVYLGAVLEYLTAEILKLAGDAAQDNKKTHIIPHHLQLTIRNDEELLGGAPQPRVGSCPTSRLCCCPRKQATPARFTPEGEGSEKDQKCPLESLKFLISVYLAAFV